MPSSTTPLILTDGSLDWSGGVNSIKTTTIASQLNPNGLMRNELAWLDNATVRGGGISPRSAYVQKGTLVPNGTYQGTWVYQPDSDNPYHIVVINGHVWKLDPDDLASAVDLSVQFGLVLPITQRVFFCQAETYLIIQAGDYGDTSTTQDAAGNFGTRPLFWDGISLWQSKGITNVNATIASGQHINEIPAALSMTYYMGRVWYAQGRQFSAGDIVRGPAAWLVGNPKFNRGRDSVLCVQENPLCVGGDGFTVPTSAGNITGLALSSNINTQLGEGTLYIGTRKQIYALSVPITRSDWINANSNNQPKMVVALDTFGWVNDRSIVSVNGDLFFQSLEPAIRSLTTAIRNFGAWGNVPISVNEYRVLQFDDRSLLWAGSGIYFDNRLLETALPYQCPAGIAHKAVVPLNFDIISSLWGQLQQSQNTGAMTDMPAWEGMWEGLNILEMKWEDFGGLERAFLYTWSDINQKIELWEILPAERFDNYDNRLTYYLELPSLNFESELTMKKLVSAEIWFDKLFGKTDFKLEYRPDGYVCWFPWHAWDACTQAQSDQPTPHYPQPNLLPRESYRQFQTLPVPPRDCAAPMARPANQGYQFQVRLTVHGYCRIRGVFLHAEPMERKLYEGLVC